MKTASSTLIQRLKALASDAAERRAAGLCLVEGPKLISDLLLSGAKAREAVLKEGFEPDSKLAALLKGLSLWSLDSKRFKSLSSTQSPQGVLAVFEMPKLAPLGKPKLAVAAEAIQDPGNLGTLLRSAWAAAADCVLLSEGCADAFSPKVLRSAAGAQWHLNVLTERDLPADLRALRTQGLAVLGLDLRGRQGLWDSALNGPLCLVVGNEGQGLSQATLSVCGASIKIEYPGKAESLNAGVSLSLALFEALRQNRKK
jgi:TrmH family RNA methyltransferase